MPVSGIGYCISVGGDFCNRGVSPDSFGKPLLCEGSDRSGSSFDSLGCDPFFLDELDELRDRFPDLASVDAFDLGIELCPVQVQHSTEFSESVSPLIAVLGESGRGGLDYPAKGETDVDQPR